MTGQKMALFSVDVLNSKHETHWMFKAELVPIHSTYPYLVLQ